MLKRFMSVVLVGYVRILYVGYYNQWKKRTRPLELEMGFSPLCLMTRCLNSGKAVWGAVGGGAALPGARVTSLGWGLTVLKRASW